MEKKNPFFVMADTALKRDALRLAIVVSNATTWEDVYAKCRLLRTISIYEGQPTVCDLIAYLNGNIFRNYTKNGNLAEYDLGRLRDFAWAYLEMVEAK